MTEQSTLLKSSFKIAHVINPFKCSEDNPSYLYYAQPITFKSMHNAQLKAQKNGINITLYSINYSEDDEIIPNYFIKLPHLKKSTKSEFPNISGNRKLPIIQEIFNSILKNCNADYIIFTNSDIGVQINFYMEIANIIKQSNKKAFVINRRNKIPKFKNNIRLTENQLDLIYKEPGVPHPGKDCFIMHRNILKRINMGLMFMGYPPWGTVLYKCMRNIYPKTHIFTDKYLTFHIGADISWSKKSNNKLITKNKQLSLRL